MTEVETLILNHIKTINDEMGMMVQRMGLMEQRMSVVETKVDSILWVERVIAGVMIAAVIGAVLSLILKRKNNK